MIPAGIHPFGQEDRLFFRVFGIGCCPVWFSVNAQVLMTPGPLRQGPCCCIIPNAEVEHPWVVLRPSSSVARWVTWPPAARRVFDLSNRPPFAAGGPTCVFISPAYMDFHS